MWGQWTAEVWCVPLSWNTIGSGTWQSVWSCNINCMVEGEVVIDTGLASGAVREPCVGCG